MPHVCSLSQHLARPPPASLLGGRGGSCGSGAQKPMPTLDTTGSLLFQPEQLRGPGQQGPSWFPAFSTTPDPGPVGSSPRTSRRHSHCASPCKLVALQT